jgi:hypothetical protein
LTVECTIGSPKVFASFTVDTMFFSTTSDPWTGPRRSARLVVDYAQSRILGREQMVGERIADRAHGCTHQP